MARAVIKKQKHTLALILQTDLAIKFKNPLMKKRYDHSGFSTVSVFHRQITNSDVFKAARFFVLSNYKRIYLVRAICVCTQRNRETFLVFFTSKKTLGCQCMIRFQPEGKFFSIALKKKKNVETEFK